MADEDQKFTIYGDPIFSWGNKRSLVADPRIQPGETGTSSGQVQIGRVEFTDRLSFPIKQVNLPASDPILRRLAALESQVAQQNATIATLNALVAELLRERQAK